MTSRQLALRFRHVLLGGAVVCWLLGAFLLILGSYTELLLVIAPVPPIPLELVGWLRDAGFGDGGLVAWGLLVVGWLLTTQWMFLRPRRGWSAQLSERGRPLRSAILAAAFVATLITGGLVYSLLELAKPFARETWAWFELPILAIWAVWALVFLRNWGRGSRYDQLDRMTRRLLAGSVLELLVAIPADVVAARKEDCYCTRGTYWGIVMGGIALLWSFGPGVVLLFFRAKVDREKRTDGHHRPATEPVTPAVGQSGS
jgi:hypothetical protein